LSRAADCSEMASASDEDVREVDVAVEAGGGVDSEDVRRSREREDGTSGDEGERLGGFAPP
jgi:hypothetical protein